MNHKSLMDRTLENGLERWRVNRLLQIEEGMRELTDDFREAQEGLAIAHRNPGEVKPDIIEYLWEELPSTVNEKKGSDY